MGLSAGFQGIVFRGQRIGSLRLLWACVWKIIECGADDEHRVRGSLTIAFLRRLAVVAVRCDRVRGGVSPAYARRDPGACGGRSRHRLSRPSLDSVGDAPAWMGRAAGS